METANDLVATPAASNGASCRHAARGSRNWLRGWRGLAVAGVVVIAGTGLVLSRHWLDTANLVPLLFVLPCMAIMFMCMKGINRGRQTDSTTDPRN